VRLLTYTLIFFVLNIYRELGLIGSLQKKILFLQDRIPFRVTHAAFVFLSSRLLCSVISRLVVPSPRWAGWDTCKGAPTLKSVRVQNADKLRVRKITSGIESPLIFITLCWASALADLLLDSYESSFMP